MVKTLSDYRLYIDEIKNVDKDCKVYIEEIERYHFNHTGEVYQKIIDKIKELLIDRLSVIAPISRFPKVNESIEEYVNIQLDGKVKLDYYLIVLFLNKIIVKDNWLKVENPKNDFTKALVKRNDLTENIGNYVMLISDCWKYK